VLAALAVVVLLAVWFMWCLCMVNECWVMNSVSFIVIIVQWGIAVLTFTQKLTKQPSCFTTEWSLVVFRYKKWTGVILTQTFKLRRNFEDQRTFAVHEPVLFQLHYSVSVTVVAFIIFSVSSFKFQLFFKVSVTVHFILF